MGQPIRIIRLEHSASDLRSIAAKCRDGGQVRRLSALALVLEGHSRADAAERNGMTARRCATGCIATTPMG